MKENSYSRNYPRCFFPGGSNHTPGEYTYKKGVYEPYKDSGFRINTQGNFKIGGRSAPAQTHDEFIESVKKQLKKERRIVENNFNVSMNYGSSNLILTDYVLLSIFPTEKDIDNKNDAFLLTVLVQYLFRTKGTGSIACKFSKDLKYYDSFKELVILGERKTVDGVIYLEVLSGASDRINFMRPTVAYYIYFDGKYFRVYTPSFENLQAIDPVPLVLNKY